MEALSYQDYLKVLEKEYLTYLIRSKFYQKEKDLHYFDKVMKEKEKRIKDISLKNRIVTIFSNNERKLTYLKLILPLTNYPKFLYNNKEGEFRKKDYFNYYKVGQEFQFVFEKRPHIHLKVGVLNEVNFQTNTGTLLLSTSNLRFCK